MEATVAKDYITEEDYRTGEAASIHKNEWFNGEVFPMPSGSENHTIITGNIYSAAKSALRGKEARVRPNGQRIKVATTGFETYADALIFVPPGRYLGEGNSVLLTPKVIFEVLSDATEKHDRRSKFEQYKRISTFTDYVLIAQDAISVEHFCFSENGTESGWNYFSYLRRSDSLRLESIGISIALEAIYEELDLPAPLLTIANT